MKNVPLAPFIMLAAALVGVADAFYLAHASFTGASLSCGILEGCNTVAKSPYAFFFGIPLSYFGLIFYLYMLGVAALLVYDPFSRGMRTAALLYGAVGLGYSIYFESLQFFVIHAICIYCLISAILTLVLFLAALWHFLKTRESLQSTVFGE